jgi:hypothetical protein
MTTSKEAFWNKLCEELEDVMIYGCDDANVKTIGGLTQTHSHDTIKNVDGINHPSHYTFGRYEVINVLEDWFPNDPIMWQIVKYLARWDKKGDPLSNLRKAEFYLKRKIQKELLKQGRRDNG